MLERLKTLIRDEVLLQKTSDTVEPEPEETQVIVARQPVFDKNGAIWGYELLYRKPHDVDAADIASGAVATANVIINGFETVRPSLKKTQKVLINFTGDLLETQIITLLPVETCVVEILEDVCPTPAVMEAVIAAKKAGYTIAVDDYVGQKSLEPFLPLADIIKIDVMGLPLKDVAQQMLRLRGNRYKAALLAEKVENEKSAAVCRELGFTLFQGYFFSKPEVVRGKKISPSQAIRMQIFALCVADEVDMRALSDAVQHDPVITARLLRFANSAHFGFRDIRTVHRALTIVGTIPFMQWLCVNILASLENSQASHDLAYLASQRAKFLECLSKELALHNALPAEISVSSLFLMGLFSLLESVTHMPLDELLDGIPLDPNVLTALAGGDSPYVPWLTLMNLYERGKWEESFALARRMHLTEKNLSSAYAEALEWSSAFFHEA